MEIKKTDNANIENLRPTVFLVALVVVLSACFVALEWKWKPGEIDFNQILETLEQDLDLQAMKEKEEMVAAISAEEPSEPTRVVVAEETDMRLEETEALETTTSEIVLSEEETAVEEAVVEEVALDLIPEDSKMAEEVQFRTLEELPEFPGGHSAFIKWIDDNLKYPEGSKKKKAKGRVVISFIVDATGAIQNINLEQGVEREIDLAAMTLFNRMPRWKPGKKNGETCATMVAVPINFEP